MRCLIAVAFSGCVVTPAQAQTPFIPDDPYFYTGTPVGFPGQWHLDKQTSGIPYDVNIRGAWDRGLTGAGVTIGILEGMVDWQHPDLISNVSLEHSWDFLANVPVEQSPNIASAHATSVAGVAAARGRNGIGVTGAAPFAQLATLTTTNIGLIQQVYSATEDAQMAAGLHFNNANDDSGINIKSLSYHPSNNLGYVEYPLAEQAVRAATAAGAIVVFHTGNHRSYHGVNTYPLPGVAWYREPPYEANTTKSGIRRLPEVINVAALNANGTFASYSNFGSNVTATAPVGDAWWSASGGHTTTDNTGSGGYNGTYTYGEVVNPLPDHNYVTGVTGTSFAAPLLSGVLALAKEAQPRLDTRFAKHLLARTSVQVDVSDSTPMGGWTTNSAGIHFNNNYGFGLIDADALTLAASEYTGVTPLQQFATGVIQVGANVPLNSDDGFTRAFSMTQSGLIEEVIVNLRIGQDNPGYFERGDVEAWITSPSGVKSVLMYRNAQDGRGQVTSGAIDWPFLTNAFWGESLAGEWSVTVRDTNARNYDDLGTKWLDFEVEFRTGTLILATAGDFNADSSVDGNDFLVWQRDLGSMIQLRADDNRDGVVDSADYAIWRDNFGQGGSAGFMAIPEPTTASLLLGFVSLVARHAAKTPGRVREPNGEAA